MEYSSAVSRRNALRAQQTHRTGTTPDSYDRAAMARYAQNDGVPTSLASTVKGDFKDRPDEYRVIGDALATIPAPSHEVGLAVVSSQVLEAGRLAAAVYSGAIARALSVKWVNFPELATRFQERVSMSAERDEWDDGQLSSWQHDLDNMRYCYDLVVVHGVDGAVATDFVARELYSLLSIRSGRCLYTVVTARSGALTLSNVFETALVPLIEECYASYRLTAKATR